jgi:SAM-dependent methyltransferase
MPHITHPSPAHDEPSAETFYATPRGQAAAAAITQRLSAIWPDLAGMSVLGLGYPAPFLPLWQTRAYRCLNATSSQHAPAPRGSCSADAMRLPFPDLAFDRILVIHGVEPYGNDERLLRELWRVLKDDGRLLVVAPNRMGLWAHVDSTPFGQGQPYSQGQIDRLLASGMFRPERRDRALFTPPSHMPVILRLARFWEKAGHALIPQLAGVTLTEAVKDVYAAVPADAVVRRRVVLSEAA